MDKLKVDPNRKTSDSRTLVREFVESLTTTPRLDTLALTVRSWEYEILAYHATGQSNGPTEAVNLIEKVRRIGHGFRNYDNYRHRLLLRCGVTRHHQPANRIRARQPRIIA